MKPEYGSDRQPAESAGPTARGAASTRGAKPITAEREARLNALARLLDDESPAVWEEVSRQLRAAGPRARAILRRRTRDTSARTRGRARALLLQIDRRRAARRLLRFACQPEPGLESGMWLLSRFHTPGLDLRPYRKALDAMGREVRDRADRIGEPLRRCLVLRDYLGRELKFGGSIAEFEHPDNACLHRAIERKAGLPLTLVALYAAVARRAGLQASPLPLPGHIMLRVTAGERSLVLDPYNMGEIRSQHDILAHLDKFGQSPRAAWLKDGDDRQVLARQLRNLLHALELRQLKAEMRLLAPVLEALEDRIRSTSDSRCS